MNKIVIFNFDKTELLKNEDAGKNLRGLESSFDKSNFYCVLANSDVAIFMANGVNSDEDVRKVLEDVAKENGWLSDCVKGVHYADISSLRGATTIFVRQDATSRSGDSAPPPSKGLLDFVSSLPDKLVIPKIKKSDDVEDL